ncbi:amino acid ABC transporter permease [Neorhizobium sp. CSC1952]|uniref:Polar amino acid transport system permease protein n=1 Tax=Xaviernesmea oryzae TaxID=464029 RepID=A0A1X7DB56_9HYPH|nr:MULTISPECIES: amino acid ABC transporter permease [Rhizobium/Agrobacterium group]WJR65086.1 amino acid ABC transporter permease [Rhizobium sp. CSC1952]SMF12213.1 polar amino acid transport system permease protein [Xaviernesmea oryzae]
MTWDFEVFWAYLFDPRIMAGALTTIIVATLCQALATAVGFLVALGLRGSPVWSAPARLYIGIFRGTPPLVLLLLFYFGLPQLGLRLSVLEAGVLGLSLYGAAYMAEIIKAGLNSVDKGQVEAARSLGFSRAGTMRSILLPQAVRIILPPFGNEFTSMMRTTSLLSVISFEELLRVTTLAINQTFRPLELYAVAALYYLAMTTAWMIVQHWLEARASRGTARPQNAPMALTH